MEAVREMEYRLLQADETRLIRDHRTEEVRRKIQELQAEFNEEEIER